MSRDAQPSRRVVSKKDERVVQETDRTVPVEPPKPSKADEPMNPDALDHRRQIVGTDEPKDKTGN